MKMRYSIIFISRILWIALSLATLSLASIHYLARAQTTDWALQFDGSAEPVLLARTADIIGAGWDTTKSVNLWIKPSTGNTCYSPDPPNCELIFGDQPRSWGITIGGYSIPPYTLPDRIWVWNFDGDTTFISIPYTPDEWVNIALVHNGGVLYAYKNGVLAGSQASGTTQPFFANPVLYLGGFTAGPSQVLVFHGLIDEAHVWNVALTQDEIINQMYQPSMPDMPGLKAYYQMSDGPTSPPDPPRTILTDDSQFNWNGTLLDGGPGVPPDGYYADFVERDVVFIPPDPPLAPTNLSASAHNFRHVDDNWSDNSEDEFSFEVERCTGTGCSDFSLLETTLDSPGVGLVNYVDTSVEPGSTYCYRVRAANTGGESGYTNISCATVPIPLFLPIVKR